MFVILSFILVFASIIALHIKEINELKAAEQRYELRCKLHTAMLPHRRGHA